MFKKVNMFVAILCIVGLFVANIGVSSFATEDGDVPAAGVTAAETDNSVSADDTAQTSDSDTASDIEVDVDEIKVDEAQNDSPCDATETETKADSAESQPSDMVIAGNAGTDADKSKAKKEKSASSRVATLKGSAQTASVDYSSVTSKEDFIAAFAEEDTSKNIVVTEPLDITLDSSLTVKDGQSVKVSTSGNGSITLHRSGQSFAVFNISENAELTLNDVTLTGSSEKNSGYATRNYVSAIITDGTLTLTNTEVSGFSSAHGGALTINKGTVQLNEGTKLSNNRACFYDSQACGGAIDLNVGKLTMNGGSIENNLASSAWERNGGLGGAICMSSGASFEFNGGKISGNTAGSEDARISLGGAVYVGGDCTFTMNGGEMCENSATSDKYGQRGHGGAVAISGSNSGPVATVTAGNIHDNYATRCGGAFYVDGSGIDTKAGRQLTLASKTAIYNNSATTGGGIWFCEGGDILKSGNFGFITANTAKTQGDDVFSTYPYSEYGYTKDFNLYSRLLDGNNASWYSDLSDGRFSEDSEAIASIEDFLKENINERNVALHSGNPLSEVNVESCDVRIYNNSTDFEGGGIGCNGLLSLGDNSVREISLTVKKVWDEEKAVEHDPITVSIKNEDGEVIETVELNSENEWTYTFTGLPEADYTVEEDITVKGYETSYSKDVDEDGNITWTVTNKLIPPENPPENPPEDQHLKEDPDPDPEDDVTEETDEKEIPEDQHLEKDKDKTDEETTKTTTTTNENPKTGDNSAIGLWIALLAIAGGCVLVVLRKRSYRKE